MNVRSNCGATLSPHERGSSAYCRQRRSGRCEKVVMIKEKRLTYTFKWVLREMGQDRGHGSCKVDDPGLGELRRVFRSSLLPPSTLNPSDHCLSGAIEIYCRVSRSDLCRH